MVFEKSAAKLDQIIALAAAGPAAAPAAAAAGGGAAAAAKKAPPAEKKAAPAAGQEKKAGGAAAGGEKKAPPAKGGKKDTADAHAEPQEDESAKRLRAPHPEFGKVVVRFAPSPTGYLHIGGARTALFNYLYAKRHGGKFLLRIEDTDRARSNDAAVEAIFKGLRWLGLDWEGEPIFQFARMKRHAEVALELLAKGKAYKCFSTPEELDAMRKEQEANKLPPRYDGRWRERDPATAPEGAGYVVRLKAPLEGATTLKDHVQGDVTVENKQLDDMVLLRSDGTPTYMLSVVVDDHDMNVTHVIRGGDHLTNTFRQLQLYEAAGWTAPSFGHIPLIHGPDGKKLSKRHGATGAEEFQDMGYLPEGICNYLMRLGWSHGTQELFTMDEARQVFDLCNVHRSPANLDFKKLADINQHYILKTEDVKLHGLLQPFLEKRLQEKGLELTPHGNARVFAAMEHLKTRAKTLVELADNSLFLCVDRGLTYDAAAHKVLDRAILTDLLARLQTAEPFDVPTLEKIVRDYGTETNQKMAKVSQPLRVAITGSAASPPLWELMVLLGKSLSFGRIEDAIAAIPLA